MIDFMCNLFSGPCVRRMEEKIVRLEDLLEAVAGKVAVIETLNKKLEKELGTGKVTFHEVLGKNRKKAPRHPLALDDDTKKGETHD